MVFDKDKNVKYTLFSGPKKGEFPEISQQEKSLSRKIHLLKAPQRGPVDGNRDFGLFGTPGIPGICSAGLVLLKL